MCRAWYVNFLKPATFRTDSKMLLHYLCVIALLPLQHQVVPSNQCKRCQNFNTGIFDKTFEEKYETVDYVMYYNIYIYIIITAYYSNILFIGPESDHWLCLSLTHSLTHWLLFSKLDWCDPGVWKCLIKTCWGCYCCSCWWWETCWHQFGADLEGEFWS